MPRTAQVRNTSSAPAARGSGLCPDGTIRNRGDLSPVLMRRWTRCALSDVFKEHESMSENTDITPHVCGEDRKHAPYCLSCGCWNDTHPGAGAGYDCVCTNLHLEGSKSRIEQDEERRKAKGHYIRQAPPPASHYCETPSSFYAWPGEIWQCDICHQKWKFRRTLLDKIAVVQGNWRQTRG